MTASSRVASTALGVLLTYCLVTVGLVLPRMFLLWSICLALLLLDLAWIRHAFSGRALALVIVTLGAVVAPATLIYHFYTSHNVNDAAWYSVAADLGGSSVRFRNYLGQHGKCPGSMEELAGRPLRDAFSGRSYLVEERNGLCVMRSVGPDQDDDQMARAFNPADLALTATGFPLRAIPFGGLMADRSCCDGDVWLACSKDGTCELSY